jgi:DNA-binding response OmpR family regulator
MIPFVQIDDRRSSAQVAARLSQVQRFLFAPEVGGGARTEPEARILIIEDDLLIASQIEAALTEAGFEVVGTASSGEAALELVRVEPPDLAVVDVRLPGDRDGVDTALEMRRTHGVRCVFTSAYSDPQTRGRAAPASPFGWLQKPYAIPSLIAMVRQAASELRGQSS